MQIKVGISNRHIHLTKEDYEILFKNEVITQKKPLVQPDEYASNMTVTIKGPKDSIEKVRVLGPFRSYTQVEVSTTDTYKLGITPKVSNSGDLDHAEQLEIIGPHGQIKRKCAIVPTRHIHLNKEDIKNYNLDVNKIYKVKITNEKSAILENVYLKPSENGVLELHLDTDDANACLLKQGDYVELIK